MKKENEIATAVLFVAATAFSTGLVHSFSNASKTLFGAGFTDINVKPTGLASPAKEGHIFANDFEAKDHDGKVVTGTYSQSFYGKNKSFTIKNAK
jgi:hypothetical protein